MGILAPEPMLEEGSWGVGTEIDRKLDMVTDIE